MAVAQADAKSKLKTQRVQIQNELKTAKDLKRKLHGLRVELKNHKLEVAENAVAVEKMESFLLINKREYTTLQNKKKRYKKALKREQTNQAKVNEALEKVRKESDAARDEITQLKARHEALEAAR